MERQDLFVSATGHMQKRWREAAPGATVVRPEDLAAVPALPPILWLHLRVADDPAQLFGRLAARWAVLPAVVVLAEMPDDDHAMACFGFGARGYCNCHADVATLRSVADVVANGGTWLGPTLLSRLLKATRAALPEPREAPGWAARLTEREREVALAIAEGASNKEIARQLDITERTVKAHSGAIFQKLAVRDRLQLSLLIHRGSGVSEH